MQLLHSPRSLTLINETAPYGFTRSSSLLGQVFRLNSDIKCPQIRTFGSVDVRPRGSGGYERMRVKAAEATASGAESKDQNDVFVGGATGKVGSRTVRELLKLGNKVRAGVRSAQRAESLVQSVKQMKLDADAGGSTPPIERLVLVKCDLEKKDQIGPALGNASTVICCIGASEKEISDVTGPYRIDYLATKNLIDAATSAKVDHFILLTSLGTNKVGWPAAILNLFWGVLIWKRKAEEALLASGLPYTIVRPGGMERPTDSYKETHNMVLAEEDTRFGGQVSNLQVAELLAYMAKNPALLCCKVVEVIAETTAPLTPMGELLTKIPSQRSCEGKFSSKEAVKEVQPGNDLPKSLTITPPVEEVSTETKSNAATPLSPYIVYEGLKPPTSPTPTPSTGSAAPKGGDSGIGPIPTVAPSPVKVKHSSSPYASYEDLKPPTLPTPTPSSDSVVPSVPASSTESEVKHTGSKATPLSPYTMYEDMKSPASPSPKKL